MGPRNVATIEPWLFGIVDRMLAKSDKLLFDGTDLIRINQYFESNISGNQKILRISQF